MFKSGLVPEDGRGLNPLLQEFLDDNHPPILFTGIFFTLHSFLLRHCCTHEKMNTASGLSLLCVDLFSAMVLGTGIMLGGYWAYGVLGWGGYWGWIPLEFISRTVDYNCGGYSYNDYGQKTGSSRKQVLFLLFLLLFLYCIQHF